MKSLFPFAIDIQVILKHILFVCLFDSLFFLFYIKSDLGYLDPEYRSF